MRWVVCAWTIVVICLTLIVSEKFQIGCHEKVDIDTSRVDTAKADLKSKLEAADDSLQKLIDRLDTANGNTILHTARILIHDTLDTGRIDTLKLVKELVIDDSSCRKRCDSLRGELQVSNLRTQAYQQTPAPVAPSSTRDRNMTASILVQGDEEAIRTGLSLDWRWRLLQVGGEAYARKDGTHPGASAKIGINF